MSINPRVAELEQKYIELLEQKIRRLEGENSAEGKPSSMVSHFNLLRNCLFH